MTNRLFKVSKVFIACTALSLAACGGPENPFVDEVDVEQKDPIVGGSATTIEANPWQISLQSSSGSHFCGGSIIAPTWILTAQHCVEGSSPSSMRVLAGVTRRSQSGTGQIRNVAQIIRYPGYTDASDGRDAALLRLSTALDLSGSRARAIPIATPADETAGLTDPGLDSFVTGWGTLTSGGSSLPDTLQGVSVPLVSNEDASDAYGQNIGDDQIAAGVLGVGGRDSCQGDSGGPLTVENADGTGRLLAGIVSWGNGCADPDFPGMYARVSFFAEWVNQNIGPANVAPTVSITSPTAGSTIQGTITITANASDSDGTVARVRFTLPDGTSSDDTSSPYSVSWDSRTIGDGPTTIRAVAIDDRGTSSAENAVSVTTANGNPMTCAPNGTFSASGLPITIPDNNPTGIRGQITTTGAGTVSTLRLSATIRHTWRGDLVVNLVSPRGTVHSVSNRAGGNADDLVVTDLSINTFANEPAGGTWALVVSDREAQDVGTLQSFSLAITASCNNPPPPPPPGNWSGSATPNMATVDNGSACTTLTVTQTGDASAVRLDIAGTHDFRSILRGTLTHNGTTVTAFPVGTFAREAGAFSFTNRAISGLSGDAAGEWRLCIIDTDAFGDSGTLNSWSVHN
jgi:secreted trypsin-like serine protease/subtilisin-like proprotein convertase family protein